ncbi:MAG: class I SAM-dependent methyltransferase [Clostridia bacterium]|nr:class I SAM-dependent methyltransferase [Clostridia bacterium]
MPIDDQRDERFQGSEISRARREFNLIAPVYDMILGRSMTRLYRLAVDALLETHPFSPMAAALDVGTGTGLLAGVLAERGFEVTGIDVSEGMLRAARRRRGGLAAFRVAPAHSASAQPGAPYDLVCSAMLLHGFPRDYRQLVLKDMCRASRRLVMIVDYVPHRSPFTSVVERLEGSHYPGFLREFADDLAASFESMSVRPLSPTCGVYICDGTRNRQGGI